MHMFHLPVDAHTRYMWTQAARSKGLKTTEWSRAVLTRAAIDTLYIPRPDPPTPAPGDPAAAANDADSSHSRTENCTKTVQNDVKP